MFIRICDLEIEIQNRYAFLEKMCKDYSVDFSENPAFSVAVSEEEIDEEKRISQIEMNRGAYEATVVLRKIAGGNAEIRRCFDSFGGCLRRQRRICLHGSFGSGKDHAHAFVGEIL